MRSDIIITKASGEKEPFEKSKLYQSMLRAGASATLANQIVQTIEIDLTEGMSTKSIYKMAHSLLSKAERPVARRYHLKNGIMELGPSGFPFEKTKEYSISNASKGYLPQISLNGQATYQSTVAELPISIPNLSVPSLSKDQYKIYGEINQPITDVHAIKQQKELVRANMIGEEQKIEIIGYINKK